MEPDFWHQRWAKGEIGFHEGEANALLVRHFGTLGLPQDSRILVPLCGKTRDIAWLLAQGHRVVGAELSALAVADLFRELGVEPEVTPSGASSLSRAPGIKIFVGDFFNLTAEQIATVDAIYDRAALVALPQGLRDRYAARLAAITQRAPQLLICFEYDQTLMQGPPFSIDADEVARVHGGQYAPQLLARQMAKGGLRGRPAQEAAWLLR